MLNDYASASAIHEQGLAAPRSYIELLYNRLVASREQGNAEGTEVSEAGEDTPMTRSAAGKRENMEARQTG